MANDIEIDLRVNTLQARAALKQAQKDVRGFTAPTIKDLRRLAKSELSLAKTQKALNDHLRGSYRPFEGWALSVMFFGMALQRIFNQIWTSSQKVFQDVMHSVEGTVTGFDQLNMSLDYLWYSVGAALEPFAYALSDIVSIIAEWVSENPRWTAAILGIMAVLGTLSAAGGMLVLSANGFYDLGVKMGYVKSQANGLMSMNWGAIGSAISKGIGTIAIGYAFFVANDAITSFKNGDALGVMQNGIAALAIASGGLLLYTGVPIAGAALLAIGIGFKLLAEDKFFQTAGNLVGWLIAGFAVVGDYIKAVFETGLVNSIKIGVREMLLALNPIMFIFDTLSQGKLKDAMNTFAGIEDVKFDLTASFSKNMALIDESMKAMDQMAAAQREALRSVGKGLVVTGLQGEQFSNEWIEMALRDTITDKRVEDDVISRSQQITMNITQQPGENLDMLVRRIIQSIQSTK